MYLSLPKYQSRQDYILPLLIASFLCASSTCLGQTFSARWNQSRQPTSKPAIQNNGQPVPGGQPAPTITKVSHTTSAGSTTLTITGTNFVSPLRITINGGAPITVPKASVTATTATAVIAGTAIITDLVVITIGGTAELSAGTPTTGGADLNLPNFGNGLAVVPTPSLDYCQIYIGSNNAFTERLWGNTLGIDSTRQRLGAKLLMPEISLFGLKLEGDLRFTNQTSPITLSGSLECNFLVKKVSDTTGKTSNNFNPFFFQPRLGIVGTFFRDNFFIAAYSDFLSVVGSNDQFSALFNTHSKNVFVFPEVDLGGLLSIGTPGNQALKFQLNLIVNNGDAQFISGSHDVLIPVLKIGFVSSL
jgi:hypothetical protein